MKTFLYLQLLLIVLTACGSSSDTSSATETSHEKPIDNELNIKDCIVNAANDKLEIVTWNIEHFPKTGKTTEELAGIIRAMNVDVIALQEIKSKEVLDILEKLLPGYKSVIMQRSGMNLAYLYKTSEISLSETPYGILQQHEEMPRSPYVLPIHSKTTNLDILLVNNHLKAFGDAKSQKKRKVSCFLIKKWIDNKHANDNVIVLGDLNDEITDSQSDNVFQIFLDDKENYLFADREIALRKNKSQWSYPSRPSHIDHILLSNELFDNEVETFTYTLGNCAKDYDKIISDHYPVCIVLK